MNCVKSYLSGIKHKAHHKVDTEFEYNDLNQGQRNISNDGSNVEGRGMIQSEMLVLFKNTTALHESTQFSLSNQSVKQEREQERTTTRELSESLVHQYAYIIRVSQVLTAPLASWGIM